MAALYDGDDNRVFTASRKEGKNTYQLSKASQRKASQVVSHHTQPQVDRKDLIARWSYSKIWTCKLESVFETNTFKKEEKMHLGGSVVSNHILENNAKLK